MDILRIVLPRHDGDRGEVERASRVARITRALVVTCVLVGPTIGASAQEPLSDNAYNIDLVHGPVLASSRIVGLAGAYTALASGIDGVSWNPASVASRTVWEHDYFEWEVGFSILFPGSFSSVDFFNNGNDSENVDDLIFLHFGGRLQFGEIGVGLLFDSLSLVVETEDETFFEVPLREGHLVSGYGLMDGQVVIGGGLVFGSLAFKSVGLLADQFYKLTSFGLEAGALLRFEGQRWRLGVSARTPPLLVEESFIEEEIELDADGVASVRGLVLPDRVHVPWQIRLGAAVQFGRRPLNHIWREPPNPRRMLRAEMHDAQCAREEQQLREEMTAAGQSAPAGTMCPYLPRNAEDAAWRSAEWQRQTAENIKLEESVEQWQEEIDRAHERLSRHYYLLTAEVLLVGATPDGVGADAFFDQVYRESGASVGIGLRLGFEFEPWRDRLKLRAGGYLEPARYEGSSYRPHGTAGLELKLFRIPFLDVDLALTGVFDGAEGYISWGVGIGFWH